MRERILSSTLGVKQKRSKVDRATSFHSKPKLDPLKHMGYMGAVEMDDAELKKILNNLLY